jgi:hypothetical protein
MMSRMTENGGGLGGLGGMMGGGGFPGGFGGGYAPEGSGVTTGGMNIGGFGGGELMSMIPQLMRVANVGGGRHGRRHRRR